MRFKAAVLREYMAPFSIEEVDITPPEQGWVPIRVKAVGVCGRDVVVWRGGFPNLRPPLLLGHEVFGEYKGQAVGVYPGIGPAHCAENVATCTEYRVLGEHYPGGYAEYVYVPRENLVELPSREYERFAAGVCGVATFMHAARVAGLGAGSKVLVTGASGGVGIHGVQYLLHMGVEVYAVTRSEEKARILEDIGAEPVLAEKGFGVKLAREKGRVDAVFEVVGAATINESIRALKPRGVLVLIGNVEGKPITLSRPALLVMREYRVTGSAAFTLSEYRAAIRFVAGPWFKPFYRVYGLGEVNEAYRDITGGRLLGRAVLRP